MVPAPAPYVHRIPMALNMMLMTGGAPDGSSRSSSPPTRNGAPSRYINHRSATLRRYLVPAPWARPASGSTGPTGGSATGRRGIISQTVAMPITVSSNAAISTGQRHEATIVTVPGWHGMENTAVELGSVANGFDTQTSFILVTVCDERRTTRRATSGRSPSPVSTRTLRRRATSSLDAGARVTATLRL